MPLIGDTVRLRATFFSYEGTPADPDNVVCTIYSHIGEAILESGEAQREAEGVYYYDYTIPAVEGALVYEFAGEHDGQPTVGRTKLNISWV
jgi:hypothetical protein